MVVARMKCSLLVIGLVLFAAFASEGLGQQNPQGRGRGGPGGRGFPGGFGGGPVELLQRPDVQAELELLDDQKDEARAVAEKFNNQRRELFSQFRGGNANETDREAVRERIREAFQKMNEQTEESLSFLLPHQRKRLSQLQVQFRMRAGGGALGALASRQVSENLQLSEEQREKLRDKGRELGQELRKKIAELQREFQEKMLAELDPEQRAKFQELVGDPFEFQDQGPGRGRPGGGRPPRPERPENE